MIAHHVFWPGTVTITPVVEDDAWGGALSYEWIQLSGPGTFEVLDGPMVATGIFDPGIFDPDIFDLSVAPDLTSVLGFPEITGVYILEFRVTREDGLVGYVRYRVVVYTIVAEDELPENDGPVEMLVNGAPVAARINTVNIDNSFDMPQCLFQVFGRPVHVGNEVVLSRGGVQLFGGVCLSLSSSYLEGHLVSSPNLVGYAWHLTRRTITKDYNGSIASIFTALIAYSYGGVTTSSATIAPGLPSTKVSFKDTVVKDAIDQLVGEVRNAHWFVDAFKVAHLNVLEPSGDPLPLSSAYSGSGFTLQEDLSQSANRVVVTYTVREENRTLIDRSGRIPIDSLEGYDPGGGEIEIEGNLVHYSGIGQELINQVYGRVQIQLTSQAVYESGGEFANGTTIGYSVTLVTAEGETPVVMSEGLRIFPDFSTIDTWPPRTGWDGQKFIFAPYGWVPAEHGGEPAPPANAVRLGIGRVGSRNFDSGQWDDGVDGLLGDPLVTSRITAINVYRSSNELPHSSDSNPFFVGSLVPHGGIFVDKLRKNSIEGRFKRPPHVNTADVWGYYLRDCYVTEGAKTNVPGRVMVEDLAAQATLSAQLGGGSGVIEAPVIDAGDCSRARAQEIGRAYLDSVSGVVKTVTVSLRDDASKPGQVLSANFPELDLEDDLKIHQVSVDGFELGVPHEYQVTAGSQWTSLQDLLRPKRVRKS